jgi:citrate lyase subunit beta/citryl-CoA lyase
MRVLRSMLYVPANSWRMILTASGEGADAVILDLEDGCPMAEKETGRIFARDAIPSINKSGVSVFVRVNSLETELTVMDISYVMVQGLNGVMLAKTETAEEITQVDKFLEDEEHKKGIQPMSTSLIALLETPRGILNIREIIAASKRIVGVGFGAGDYSREMGAGMGVTKLTPEEYFPMLLHARSIIAMEARAAGIQAIDTPFFGMVIDLDGLSIEAEKAKYLGFSGKQLTHPRHIEPVNRIFSPDREEVDFARQVVEAYEEATAKGLGATTLGGKMIDYGSFKRAEALLLFSSAIEEKRKKRIKEHV